MVRRSNGCPVIDSKWVSKCQQAKAAKPNCYKARLGARGYKQEHGINCDKTFIPVDKYDSLCIIMATANYKDIKMRQFDVRTAFLNGYLQEDVYMKIPKGVECDEKEYV